MIYGLWLCIMHGYYFYSVSAFTIEKLILKGNLMKIIPSCVDKYVYSIGIAPRPLWFTDTPQSTIYEFVGTWNCNSV